VENVVHDFAQHVSHI